MQRAFFIRVAYIALALQLGCAADGADSSASERDAGAKPAGSAAAGNNNSVVLTVTDTVTGATDTLNFSWRVN